MPPRLEHWASSPPHWTVTAPRPPDHAAYEQAPSRTGSMGLPLTLAARWWSRRTRGRRCSRLPGVATSTNVGVRAGLLEHALGGHGGRAAADHGELAGGGVEGDGGVADGGDGGRVTRLVGQVLGAWLVEAVAARDDVGDRALGRRRRDHGAGLAHRQRCRPSPTEVRGSDWTSTALMSGRPRCGVELHGPEVARLGVDRGERAAGHLLVADGGQGDLAARRRAWR